MRKIFGDKVEGITYKERHGVYGLFQNSDNKIGVVQVRDTHFLVGGGIEEKENHEAALKREFLEEVGYSINIQLFLDCLTEYHYSAKDDTYYKMIAHIYMVELNGKVLKPVAEDHFLTWIDYDGIDGKFVLDYQDYILKKVFK